MRVFVVCLFITTAAAAAEPAPRELSVEGDGVTLHTVVYSDGPAGEAVIVIHGGPGLSHDYLLPLSRVAEPGLAVVFYDQRGTGGSTRPRDRDYSIAAHVADLEAVRAAVGAERVHVLGHSWGTLVAIAYAVAHPRVTASVMLVGMGAPTAAADRRTFGAAFGPRKAKLIREGAISGVKPADCSQVFDYVLPVHFADPHHPGARALAGTYTCDVGRATNSAAGEWDVRSDLAGLQAPLLLVDGDADANVKGLDETWALVSRRGAIRAVLRDCGHFPFIECPTPFFGVISRFLGQFKY